MRSYVIKSFYQILILSIQQLWNSLKFHLIRICMYAIRALSNEYLTLLYLNTMRNG